MNDKQTTEYVALVGLDWGYQSHAIAIQPVLITAVSAPESGRAVHIICSAQGLGNLPADTRYRVGILDGVEQEAALEARAHPTTIAVLFPDRICSASKCRPRSLIAAA